MKRVALAGTVLLVVAGLALPGVIGRIAEREIRSQLESSLPAQALGVADPGWHASVRTYERGWFGSRATLQLRLDDSMAAQALAELDATGATSAIQAWARDALQHPERGVDVDIDIAHGPVLLGAGGLGWLGIVARPNAATPAIAGLYEILGVDGLVEARVAAGFAGAADWRIDFQSFDWRHQDSTVTFSGGRIDGTYTPASQQARIRSHFEALRIVHESLQVELEELRGDSELAFPGRTHWLGTSETSIARIALRDDDQGRALEAQGVQLRQRIEPGSGTDLIDSETTVVAATIESRERGATTSGAANIAMSVRGVPVEVLEKWANHRFSVSAITQSHTPEHTALVQESLAALLTAGPALEVGPLEIRWGDDVLRGRAALAIDGQRVPAQFPWGTPLAIPLLLAAAALDAEISATESVVGLLVEPFIRRQVVNAVEHFGQRVTPQELETMVRERVETFAEGLIAGGLAKRAADGHLATEIAFQGGKLTVNGAAVPLFR